MHVYSIHGDFISICGQNCFKLASVKAFTLRDPHLNPNGTLNLQSSKLSVKFKIILAVIDSERNES